MEVGKPGNVADVSLELQSAVKDDTQIELSIICVTVKLVHREQLTERKVADDEHDGTEDRALENTRGEGRWLGRKVFS